MLCLISGAIHYRIRASKWSQLVIRATFKKPFSKHRLKGWNVVNGGLCWGGPTVVSVLMGPHPSHWGHIPVGAGSCSHTASGGSPLFLYLERNASASLLLPEFPLGMELVNSCRTKNNTCSSRWQPRSLPWLSTEPKGFCPGSKCWDLWLFKKKKQPTKKPTKKTPKINHLEI